MNARRLPYESWWFAAALLLALIARVAGLGALPLNDAEARWALPALDQARGGAVAAGAQVAYSQLTALLFTLFGDSNWLARLIPALAGSLLALLPWLLRRQLGALPAVIFAFALALDPGLISAARQAGTPVPAAGGLLLGLALLWRRKPALAGVALAFALLGGDRFWFGVIGVLVAGIAGGEGLRRLLAETEGERLQWRPLLIGFAVTLLAVSTLLLIKPGGISGVGLALADFFAGWGRPSGVGAGQLLAALAAYTPLAVLFGGWGAARGALKRDLLDLQLAILALAFLLLALIYPARQVSDLTFVLAPLWGLAAREIARHFRVPAELRVSVLVTSAVTFVVLGFIALRLFTLSNLALDEQSRSVSWVAAGGALLLLVLAGLLVGWGWEPLVARRGLLVGALLALLLYSLFGLTGATGLRAQLTAEYWLGQRVAQADLMAGSLDRLGQYDNASRLPLDIRVVGVDSPSLRWALRDQDGATFSDALPVDAQPALVITPVTEQPALAAAYRGTNILWTETPQWQNLGLYPSLRWIMYHRAPVVSNNLILWARADLFPGIEVSPTGQ